MEKITKRITLPLAGELAANVSIGESIKPGTLIGTVTVPTILEEHDIEQARILVDDGVYVQAQTPLFEKKNHGLYKEVIGATHEGIVRVSKRFIRIVSDDREEEVKSDMWGKIIAFNETSYTLEIKQVVLPIFVSAGSMAAGELLCLFDKGTLVTPHQILDSDNVAGKIVALAGSISAETYTALINKGASAVLAASIDWSDYLKIFRQENPRIGILHGFGMFPLWRWYFHLLNRSNGLPCEIDLATSRLFLPMHDILLGSLEHDLLLFKEFWWGKQVKELQHESGEMIAYLETQEQTPVLGEELFNIR